MGARLRPVEIAAGPALSEYRLVEGQSALVEPLIAHGRALSQSLGTSRVWMINSTASGGGVAATLPHTCAKLREVGLDVRWLVLEPDDARFFTFTKRLHNLLHGAGERRGLGVDDRDLYARVCEEGARALVEHLEAGDLIVVHDPQPCGIASYLPPQLQDRLVWRCHVGVPFHNECTEAGWRFLAPWLAPYAELVFTSERYAPAPLKPRVTTMQPAIDPLSHKNRPLPPYKLLGVLRASGLIAGDVPEWARFAAPAERWVDGRFVAEPLPELLVSPIILHVSRFDPLKGFAHSVEAFRELTSTGVARATQLRASSARTVDELSCCRLVLAGPDPFGVADDPEAAGVLRELCARRDALAPDVAARVHIVKLPMVSPKQNALMVNALQRLASVVVQPSLQEGFGLTVTEALWKGVPVIGSNVGGIAQQIRPRIDGRIIDRADDIDAFAQALTESLVLVKETEHMAASGRHRASEHFLLLREVFHWVRVLQDVVARAPALPQPAGVAAVAH